MPSPRVGCGSLLDCAPHRRVSSPPPRLPGTYLPRRAGGGDCGRPRGQEHLCAAPAWRSRDGPSGREGGQGEVRAVPSALVTGSGRAPRGRAPEEEEGDRRSRSWGRGARARAGGKDRERRARGGMCLPAIWSVGRAGVEGGGSGRPVRGGQVLPVGARAGGRATGTAWALPGAGPAARRRREEPPRVPGEPSPVSQLLPRPPPQGGGQRAPLRVSSDISSGWEGSRCTAEPGQRAGMIKEPG